MKNIKLLLLVMLISFSSCSKDDDTITEPVNTITYAIEYDSNTNLVRINSITDDTWYNAIDFNTFVDANNWSSGNSQFGLFQSWNDFRIKIVSETYELHSVVVQGIYEGYYFEGGAMFIDVPTLRDYMDDNHLFVFEVKVIQ